MRPRSALALTTALALSLALTGCLTSAQGTMDWWRGNGNLEVRLGTLPASAPGQRIADFSTLKVAVTSVVAYPVDEISPHAGVVYQPPLGIDLRQRFDEGVSKVVLQRSSIVTKPIDKVEVKLILVAANTTKPVPLCPFDAPATEKPCIAMPETGAFILDKAHDPPRMKRAKTMVMELPLAVIYDPKTQEYFIQARSADSEAPVTFR